MTHFVFGTVSIAAITMQIFRCLLKFFLLFVIMEYYLIVILRTWYSGI